MKVKNKFILDLCVAITIVVLAFLPYCHILFRVDQFITIFGLTDNYRAFAWYFLFFLSPILLMILWFSTCTYSWRIWILIPAFICFYKFMSNNFYISYWSKATNVIFYLVLSLVFMTLFFAWDKKFNKRVIEIGLNDYTPFKDLKKIFSRSSLGSNTLEQLVVYEEFLDKRIRVLEMEKKPKKTYLFIYFGIIFSSIILFAHHFFPEISQITVLGFQIKSYGFGDVNTLFWILFPRISLLGLLLIWFLTSGSWWRYVLLINVSVLIFQIQEIFLYEDKMDEKSIYKALPFVLFFVVFLLVVSKKVNYAAKVRVYQQELKKQIDEIITQKALERAKIQNNLSRQQKAT